MNLIRLILIGMIAYFVVRLVRWGKQQAPKVKRGRAKSKPDPLEGADIEDIPYTEIPPDEEDKKSNSSE